MLDSSVSMHAPVPGDGAALPAAHAADDRPHAARAPCPLPQEHPVRWTPERQKLFIERLASTASVCMAAHAAGMSRESAYRLRRRADGRDFAEAWEAALAIAAQRLTDVAFDRALNGTVETVRAGDGTVTAERTRMDNRLLMFLLRHHRPARYGHLTGVQPFNAQEAEDSPVRRFQALINRFRRPGTRGAEAKTTRKAKAKPATRTPRAGVQ